MGWLGCRLRDPGASADDRGLEDETPATRPGDEEGPRSASGGRRGLAALVVALLPAVAAVWCVPWFVTQDGPAHLYNAHIIARSWGADSPFRPYFTVRWEPLPNWAGHLALAGLVTILPARWADCAMTTITLVGPAAAIAWLRWTVRGGRGMAAASAMAALLAMNVTWLLGFTSFLLGASLFAATLGVWWGGRDRPGPRLAAALGALLVLGYFCHPVSLGLTVVGLAVLAATTPGPRRLARAGWTAAGLVPLVPLGLVYLRLTRRGGRMMPLWDNLDDPLSLRSWAKQLSWVDPISLGSRVIAPFREGTATAFAALSPVVWLLAALAMAAVATATGRRGEASRRPGPSELRGWGVLAGLLLLAGIAGPDTLGETHGHYLSQRVVLLGLVALVPLLDLGARGWAARGAVAAIAVAVALQAAFVWDYAGFCRRAVGPLMAVRGVVGRGQRVVTLPGRMPPRYRANPLRHADNLLGVGTGNIVWGDYETQFYYFPVQFRDGLDRPPARRIEEVALGQDERAADWAELLDRHHRSIDVLVLWGADPLLVAIGDHWFRTVFRDGDMQVLRRRL
jgi:hypothetical protein